jgi:hypothetical protein
VVKASHLQEREIELLQQHVRICLRRGTSDARPHLGRTLVYFDVAAVDE